jgi:hypothetical protein
MWQEISPAIKSALLFMLDKPETKDCHEFLVDAVIQFKPRATDLIDLNIIVGPGIFKRYEANFYDFKGILQYAFRRDHHVIALKRDKQTIFNRLEEGIPLLCNLRNLYISTTLEGQQMLLKKVFEVGIKYDGRVLRTPMINPALVDNYLAIKEKGLLVVEQPDDFLQKSWSCTA